MGRPKKHDRDRATMHLRLDAELKARIYAEADARLISPSLLVERLVAIGLTRLQPVDAALGVVSGEGE